MNLPHVMILSAGRRGLLVQYFQAELARIAPMSRVLGADVSPELSSACHLADERVQTLSACDPGYVENLIEVCHAAGVGLLVPTIDTELLTLSANRERLRDAGIEAVVSDHALVKQCRDKRLTASLFAAHGIPTPAVADPACGDDYPLFAKPCHGSSSQGLLVAHDPSELPAVVRDDPSMVFQEFLPPEEHDEYTVDMYYDRSSQLRCFVPRLRIATRAGEVSKARTARLPALAQLAECFADLPGARGCLTMQLFVARRDDRLAGIEINPRFGGGYPLSYEAGANYPSWILREHFNHEPIPWFDDWRDGLAMLRYDSHVLVPSAA